MNIIKIDSKLSNMLDILDTAIHTPSPAGLHQVSEATITTQSVQPQGEIPKEGRDKKDRLKTSFNQNNEKVALLFQLLYCLH